MRLLPARKRIAVVEVFGSIGGSVKSAVHGRIFSTIRRDRRIRAVVLDIDSPGGAVPASDYLYRSVAAIAEEKPVVASIRGVGASGSYMICCGASHVLASPGAIIGSIGVISVRPALEELLGRLGVGVNVTKSGEFKDLGAFWRASTLEEDAKIQGLIDDSFDAFVSIVANARKMDEDRVREIATGEVYWAPRALELGLIDEMGDLDRAIDVAAELSGAPRKTVVIGPKRSFRERLFGSFAEALVDQTASEIERRLLMASLRY